LRLFAKEPTAVTYGMQHSEGVAFHSRVVEVSPREMNSCMVHSVLRRGAWNMYYLHRYPPSVPFYNRVTLPWRMEVRTTVLQAESNQYSNRQTSCRCHSRAHSESTANAVTYGRLSWLRLPIKPKPIPPARSSSSYTQERMTYFAKH
jgi:hypothetical protein